MARRVAGGGVTSVAVGSALSAGVMFVIMAITARTLSAAQNAYVLTFIGAYQIITGLLAGLTTELTRSVAAADRQGVSATGPGPRVATVAAGWAVSVAIVAAVVGPLWTGRHFPESAIGLGLLLAVTALGWSLHASLAGALSGRADWGGVGLLLSAEAVVRLLLTVVVALMGASIAGYGGALAAASFSWVLLAIGLRRARAALAARTDVPWPRLSRRIAAAMTAQAGTAVLTGGFAALLASTTPAAEFALAAGLLQAIAVTRAPLLIPLTAFQSYLINAFVRSSRRPGTTLALFAAAIVAVGAIGAGLAWAIGPWLMRLLFAYDVSGPILAALTGASAFLALLVLIGALCQALGRHGWFLAGWILAVAVAVVVLLLPLAITPRAIIALAVGPFAGVLSMVPAVLRAPSGADAATSPSPAR